MPSFEWNKIIASILTALIVAMVSGILAGKLVAPTELEKPVFAVATTGQEKAPSAQPAAAGPAPIGPLLAKADPKKGEQEAKVCQTCHTFKKGEPNKIGPNLYGIVGDEIAHDRGGFQFSAALEKHKSEKWDPETLNKWLYKPQEFAQGTKMTFAGIDKDQERADVIAFLQSLK